jgi:DNA-binding MarR family transcriptional regulator
MSVAEDPSELAVRLQVAMSRLRARVREQAGQTKLGLTLLQLSILQRLVEHGPETAASISIAEHVTHQAVTQSVTGLKEAGLVDGERDQADGRKVNIHVTDAGRTIFENLLASREAWLTHAIEVTMALRERRRLAEAIALLEQLATVDCAASKRER